jgi:SAM-dependent methyltransferase
VQTPALEALLARATADRPAPDVALNAGVGEGLYSPMLRRFAAGARLLEFDFARPPKSTDPRAHRFSASLTAIPVRSGSVDLAICTEVLEHVADDRSAVAELRRVLSPGGSLLLSVPTPPAVYDPAHVREGYTLAQLSALFESQGLTIVEARYCMHYCFQAVLTYWRPRRVPLGVILAWPGWIASRDWARRWIWSCSRGRVIKVTDTSSMGAQRRFGEPLRVAVLADMLEEHWPSMDLVAESLTRELAGDPAFVSGQC